MPLLISIAKLALIGPDIARRRVRNRLLLVLLVQRLAAIAVAVGMLVLLAGVRGAVVATTVLRFGVEVLVGRVEALDGLLLLRRAAVEAVGPVAVVTVLLTLNRRWSWVTDV